MITCVPYSHACLPSTLSTSGQDIFYVQQGLADVALIFEESYDNYGLHVMNVRQCKTAVKRVTSKEGNFMD